jgi:F0F1-type ATP synthase assembly protein I
MAQNEDKGQQARQLTEVWSLAILFPACIAAGYGVGWGLDKLFHSSPWCAAIFTGLGVIAAFINLFRVSDATDDTDGKSSGNSGGGSADSP